MRASLSLIAICFAVGACNQTPINTPVRSFDRPSDVALACTIYNQSYQTVKNASPAPTGLYIPLDMQKCGVLEPDQQMTLPNVNNTSEPFIPELRGIVTDSARGQVALVDIPNAVLLDLDLKNPGFNFIPVGRLPVGVRASYDGYFAATVNADSCDLDVLDLSILYNKADDEARGTAPTQDTSEVARSVQLWAGDHRLAARPTAIELTRLSDEDGIGDGACHAGSVSCRSYANREYHAWIALPGCQAVVETKLALGGPLYSDPGSADVYLKAQITHALHVDPSGVTELADPTTLDCPAECTGTDAPTTGTPTMDPGVPGGTLPATTSAPFTITYDNENSQTDRLAIGDYYNERVSILTLDPVTGAPSPAQSVVLESGAIGVSRVRISPRGPAGKFLYAIARDGTARVIDLDQNVECETNPDPNAFQSLSPTDPLGRTDAATNPGGQSQARQLGCLPLGALTTPTRNGSSIGPGIQLDNGANAHDVAFVHINGPPPPTTGVPVSAAPALLVGDFAWLFGSDGRGTVINIYDACPQPNDPQQTTADCTSTSCYNPSCALENAEPSRLVDYQNNFGNPYPILLERLSHHIRNGETRFLQPTDVQDTQGTPRVQDTTVPLTITVQGSPAVEGNGFRLATLDTATREIPSLSPPTIPGYVTYIDAPDPQVVRDETWTLTWEGALPNTQRAIGRMCGAGDASCPRNAFTDAGAAICDHGVLPGDKLEIAGCAHDTDCLYTQKCIKDPGAPPIVTNGLCLTRDTDDQPDIETTLQERCGVLLRAQRYYRIGAPKQATTLSSGDVTDIMNLSEIYEPEYAPQTHSCMTNDDCSDVLIQPSIASDSTQLLPTECLLDTDATRRCLRPCKAAGTALQTGCGDGYECWPANTPDPQNPDGAMRCMRSPLDLALLSDCMTYPQHYQLRAGNAFTVIGSTSGYNFDVSPDPVTQECELTPGNLERIRLRNPRLPLAAPLCPQQPNTTTGVDELTYQGPGSPNACQIEDETSDLVMHFENAIFSFALRLPNNPTGYVPGDDTIITFGIVGGGFSLGVLLQVGNSSTPAQNIISSLVAPDQQTIYVVDEGKSSTAAGLRGQLLRLVSFAQQVDPDFVVR